MKFSHTFQVPKSDIDEHLHVNNVAYLRWIQDVALAHRKAEASSEMLENFTWFVLRHEIDYKKPSFENEEITATTWVGKPTKITCERYTEIKRGENLLVESKSIWLLLNATTKKPTRITEELSKLFEME